MKHYWALVSTLELTSKVLVKTKAIDEKHAREKIHNFFRVNKNTEIKIIEIATIQRI